MSKTAQNCDSDEPGSPVTDALMACLCVGGNLSPTQNPLAVQAVDKLPRYLTGTTPRGKLELHICLINNPSIFCSLCLIRVMGPLEPVPAVAMPTLGTSGRGNQSVTEAPVNPMFMFLDCGWKLYIGENM